MGADFVEDHRGAPAESWAAPFRKALSLRGRPEARVKWYFIWARRFAVFLSGRSLHLAIREDAEGFLAKLASSPRIDAWQVEQATDALTILLGSVFGQEWARTIRIPAPPPPPKVPLPKGDDPVERLRYAIRSRLYSVRTEDSYVFWVNRFIVFCRDGGVEQDADAVRAFLERLVIAEQMSASTQGLALNALVFYFKHVVGTPFGDLGEFQRSKRPRKLPVVLSREEVRRLLEAIEAPYRLPTALLYGGGLRLMEVLRLRVKDIDLDRRQISVWDWKGQKDRVRSFRNGGGNGSLHILSKSERPMLGTWNSAMPERPSGPLSNENTLARPAGGPGSISFQPRVFASIRPMEKRGDTTSMKPLCSGSCGTRRARPISRSPSAATRCGTASPPTCSSPARTSAACRNCSGHSDVSTTMIYTHVLNRPGLVVRSPEDG